MIIAIERDVLKKTTNCRFHYPRTIQESHELKIDFKAEPSIWYTSYGNGENKTCNPFTMESKELYQMFS